MFPKATFNFCKQFQFAGSTIYIPYWSIDAYDKREIIRNKVVYLHQKSTIFCGNLKKGIFKRFLISRK